MKKKTILLVTLLVGLALVFLLGKRKRTNQEEPKPTTRNSEKKLTSGNEERFEQKKRRYMEEREQEIERAVKRVNVPIDFWGKVIDQNGEPLGGVNITYRIQQPRVMWGSNGIVKKTVSDANGNFFITGDEGSTLGIKLFEKKGYRKTKGQMVSFTYSDNSERYVPDKTKPKIYTLIHEEHLPSLIAANGLTTLDWDGKPIRYSVRSGNFDESGEIQITARRGEVESDGKFNWSCKIEIIGGGVYEASIEDMHLAPEKGYKPFVEYGYLSTAPRWGRSTGDKYLFIILPNKKYGRLEININSRIGLKIGCKISSYINPTGSRILEYDSRLKVE